MKAWLDILLVGIVVLAIFGPKTLQSIARNAGRSAAQVRNMKDKVTEDLSLDDVKKVTRTLSKIPRSPQDIVRMALTAEEKPAAVQKPVVAPVTTETPPPTA